MGRVVRKDLTVAFNSVYKLIPMLVNMPRKRVVHNRWDEGRIIPFAIIEIRVVRPVKVSRMQTSTFDFELGVE